MDFDFEDLEFLKSINKTFEEILDNSTFWLKKCIGQENLTKLRSRLVAVLQSHSAVLDDFPLWNEKEKEWAKEIQITRDTIYRSYIWSFVKKFVDETITLPMHIGQFHFLQFPNDDPFIQRIFRLC